MQDTQQRILEILERVNALIRDSHIVLTSGRHTSAYINPDRLLPHPDECCAVGRLFAETFKHDDIEVVFAPAVGGIILSTWTAYHLTHITGREVLGVFTEKTSDNNQVLDRGFGQLVEGKRVLVVEDVSATGGSVRKVVDSVRAAGGNVVAACVMVNRDPQHVTGESVGAPLKQLGVIHVESYAEEDCPLCKRGVPVNVEVGHGKEYLARKAGEL